MGDHEGADITYAHMITPEEEPSHIQEFYKGSVIFVTGGSGFLGILLIEKLLRSCPELSKIYVLMREKRGIDPQRRLQNLCDDNIFERVRQEQPNCFEKLFVIKGDCELPDLGLSEDDRNNLIEEVDIVFHTAAALRFNEKLKKSVIVNVKCTRDLLKLARSMQKLRSFVHVSSAFVHCIRKEIDECFYDSPIDADKLISIVDVLNDRQVDLLTPELIEPFPNTLVYTKAVAESVIRTYGKGLPISIHRPSIIISTAKEPVCGWMNNLYGIAGLVAEIGLGIMHVLYTEPEIRAEIVPADYCVNSMIVSAWQSGSLLCDNLNQETVKGQIVFDELKVQDNIPIYNFVSSVELPITWGEMRNLGLNFVTKTPCDNAMYHVFLIFTMNKYLFRVCRFLFHTLQCAIMDSMSNFFDTKLEIKKTYKKIDEMSNILNYYMTEQWIFRNKNTRTLWKKLNSTDRKLFEFSMESFNWVSYLYTFVRGTRTYLLKDSLETVNHAKKKYKMFKYVHYTILTIVSLLLVQIFLWILFLIL